MKRNLKFNFLAGSLLLSMATMAQDVQKGLPGMYPSYVDFKNAPVSFTKGAIIIADENGKTNTTSNVQLIRSDKDELGIFHYRYQQTYLNIPVENATYVAHVKNDQILSENGKWIKDFPSLLKAVPMLNQQIALAAAKGEIGAQQYKWEVPTDEAFIKQEKNDVNATYLPKGELVFYSGEEEVIPSQLRLAYKFDIYAAYPASRNIVFVDANDGSILGRREIIHTTNAPGTAVTAYSGSQAITSDYTGTTYRLREVGRGNGIQTFNMKTAGANYAAAVDFTDADNNWNNVNTNLDQYATDAHWGAEKTYDYYFSRYNRNSVDNAGLILKSYVHTSLTAQGYPDNVNAFWDGSKMSYGDGNATYKPLTALDIAGHEITHAVTQYSSNLAYSTESGAMNEGFSDIFGTAIEFYARSTRANWLIGEDIGAAFRSMSNPNQFSQPDTYQGTYWYTGTADNGGVHTNSGVLNYWFYLLSVGGSGTNDKGTAFNVTAIGIDKAGAIAYRLNSFYLISTSKFADARTFGIKAAEDLYGVGSVEAVQTANAWTAVGVGGTVTPPTCTDAYETNETRTAAKAITKNVDITAKISSTTDKDWFTFTTTAAAPKVQVTVSNLPADYDVRLYNSAGTQLGISQNGGTTAETVKYNTSTAAATYYVQVYGYNGANSTSCYTLRASTSGVNFIDDPTNNGFISIKDNKTPNTFNVYPSPVARGGNITLQFTEATNSPKQIIVTDLSGRNIYSQKITSFEGNNSINFKLPNMAPGTYFIKLDENNIKKITVL
ncbi:M4 family metallopeptidase [Ferruginibacter yonginensis]|uniref:M4 family metallopeptidase n=1 Tax=Ferruginibacter yonginensis TaxID=1310416 RepID=A0ABV8QWT3_9BACT